MHASLVPRPFKRGLVHIACTCAGISIATSRISMVITCRFCMAYSSVDDKRMIVSDSLTFSLGSPSTCACNVYQVLPTEGPGYEAILCMQSYIQSLQD